MSLARSAVSSFYFCMFVVFLMSVVASSLAHSEWASPYSLNILTLLRLLICNCSKNVSRAKSVILFLYCTTYRNEE